MRNETLTNLKVWFDRYTRSFLSGNPLIDSPLTLKIDHTARVCDNIRELATSLSFDEERVCLAESIALLHDIGRFEQYRCYQTFNDERSFNHAIKGVEVLTHADILRLLPEKEKAIIIDAIRFHNAPSLPDHKRSDSMVFMRLIRDADKLDIWKVFADTYRCETPPNPTIVQHLIDLPTWEPKIVAAIMQKRTARFKDMKTLNDFKLLQLSWVFGIHFSATAAIACKRGDLFAIAGALPADPAIEQSISMVMDELETAAC